MNQKPIYSRLTLLYFFLLFVFAVPFLFSQTWISNGPSHKNIKAISVSPEHANILFAAAFGAGIFKSTDAGINWINTKSGLTNTFARSVLAINDNLVFAGTNDGIFRTTDGGTTWNASQLTLNSIRDIVHDTKTGSLYAVTYGSGLYKSVNSGASWTQIVVTDPVPGQTLSRQRSISVFGSDSLYIGGSISDIDSGGALFRSNNGGGSWVQVQQGTGIRSSVLSIAINPSDSANGLIIGTAAKGVYRSTNGGTTWSNINSFSTPGPLPDLHVNTVAFNTDYRYAGTDSAGGLYYRSLIDTVWTATGPLPGTSAPVNYVDIDGSDRNILYLCTDGKGVYKSINRGLAWQPSNSGMMGTAGRVLALNSNGNIILGTDFGDGIWVSSNGGTSWSGADTLSSSSAVTSIGITNNPLIVYAGIYGVGIFKSTDAGHVWTITDSTIINHYVRAIEVHPSDANIVYAGTGNGVFKSVTGGATWFTSSTGIPTNTSVRSMAIDITNPSVLFAGTDSLYLYKTTNSGSTWTHITSVNGFLPQDTYIRSILIDETHSNVLYAGADSGRIYRSMDGGNTWALRTQLPSVFSVRAILIHPSDRKILIASTFGSGIFASADTGRRWVPYSGNLSDPEIYSLISDNSNPPHLYAGTGSSGVFQTLFSMVNFPPTLSAIGNKFVIAGQSLSFGISSTDPNGTASSLSASPIPSGAVFNDSSNGKGNFQWNPSLAQVGTYAILFTATDGVYDDSIMVQITVIHPDSALNIAVPYWQGWNMVSVPVLLNQYEKNTVFPSAASSAFAYLGSYQVQTTLSNGPGYWLKFPSQQDNQFTGLPIYEDSFSVIHRWNIIGSLSTPVPVANVVPVPPITIQSSFWAYSQNGGYVTADTLFPGQSYWVKVSGNGTLALTSLQAKTTEQTKPTSKVSVAGDVNNQNTLLFTDSNGQIRSLFFKTADIDMPSHINALPPVPPLSAFDVRFETDTDGFIFNEQQLNIQQAPIKLQSTGNEIKIQWDINEHNPSVSYTLLSPTGDITLSGKGERTIPANALVSLTLQATAGNSSDIPKAFSLSQNYPNPFNPSTQITYTLPVAGFVVLKVYSILGEEVTELVHSIQETGTKTVRFGNENLSSGLYMYQLLVIDPHNNGILFRQTHKMMLIR